MFPSPIDTLEELHTAFRRDGMKVSACCSHIIDTLSNSLVPYQRDLGRHLHDIDNLTEILLNITAGQNHGTINTKNVLSFEMRKLRLVDRCD